MLPSKAQAYAALSAAIDSYQAIAAAGGWPAVPAGPRVEPGMRDPRVPLLRRHLLVTGDLGPGRARPAAGAEDVLDRDLAAALRLYQARHGLGVNGALDDKTVAAMAVPVEARIATMRLNLARLKRMPDMGPRYLMVNAAAKEMIVVEGGEVAFVNRVSVGRPDRQTPELRSTISRIELNPYWSVPPRIASVDLLPMIKQDPLFFERYGMRVFGTDGEINPTRIDWRGLKSMPYRLRQDPGPYNALGRIKFVFANSHSVYLHGTPVQEQFRLNGRFLTSGCIRAENPVKLAALLLGDGNPEWPEERIRAGIESGRHIVIELGAPMPIYLGYLTAWVDDQGLVHFADDIYHRDVGSGRTVTTIAKDLEEPE
ncbi:MAG: L,D-transpeptidase family protein [Rhodospirillaceae bacterium]|nr:L,D-transpeptidase family protein [Rhodospirillaceae bacterium]